MLDFSRRLLTYGPLYQINYESLVPVSYVTIFTEPYVVSSSSCTFRSSQSGVLLCSITAILISRFILDLQEVNRGLVRLHSDLETAPQSSVNFAKIIGPLGSSLVSSHDGTETTIGDEIAEEETIAQKETDTGMEIETVARV